MSVRIDFTSRLLIFYRAKEFWEYEHKQKDQIIKQLHQSLVSSDYSKEIDTLINSKDWHSNYVFMQIKNNHDFKIEVEKIAEKFDSFVAQNQ
jgi:hypothetical protein